MLQIVWTALLTVVVLGGLACGPWLVAALLARRSDDRDLMHRLVRRASWTAVVLGALAVVFPVGRVVQGDVDEASSYGLTVAGLLLLALGVALRRR